MAAGALALTSAPVRDARAAIIENVSDTPKVIEVEQLGGFQPVTIEAGREYNVPGALKVRYGAREVQIDFDEDYAIWQDGGFGPQRRLSHGNGIGSNP